MQQFISQVDRIDNSRVKLYYRIMEFGEHLRHLRGQAGLSLNALARAAGIDSTHLSRIENSKQGVPRRTTIVKLIRALGFSLTDQEAQELLAAANLAVGRTPIRGAVLGAPHKRPRSARVTLHELKIVLLQAVELISELEEIVDEED
jgi:transcriptional regulator with XRE-family HTH domain